MITVGGKEVTAVYVGQIVITAVYNGSRMIWSAIRSCFGSGYWQRSKPWSRTDGWKRNP